MGDRTPSPTHAFLPSGSAGSSPHNFRKRTNEEVYLPSQGSHTSPPHSLEASERPSTAPEQNAPPQMFSQSSFGRKGLNVHRPIHASSSCISTRSKTKPESTSAFTNTTIENNRAFQDAMKDFQNQLDKEYKAFEQKLNERDPAAELEEMEWDELEARYHAAIDPKIETEHVIMNDCSHLFRQFLIWMQMSTEREAERSLKRLRTRMAFVQTSEEKLGEKKAHYSKVVNAFHSAMALLGNI